MKRSEQKEGQKGSIDRLSPKRWWWIIPLLAFSVAWHLNSYPLPTAQAPLKIYATDLKDDLSAVFIQAIQKAKHSIFIWSYTLNDPKVIAALKQKAKEGLSIAIFGDPCGCANLKKEFNFALPSLSLVLKKKKGLMHRKMMVIDRELVFIGSANMTPLSLRLHANLTIGIYSKELALWLTSDQIKRAPRLQLREPQAMQVHLLPESTSALAETLALIEQAKNSLQLAYFTWTHPQLIEALILAAKRGVKVELIVDYSSSQGASKKGIATLMANQIEVRMNFLQGLMHHKLIYIDRRYLITGSANATKAAFTQNEDCLLVLTLNSKQREQIDQLWQILLTESKQLQI